MEEGFAMKYTTLVLTLFGLLNLVGCDTQTSVEQRPMEARTMIIGGVPAHDQDYRPPRSVNLKENLK